MPKEKLPGICGIVKIRQASFLHSAPGRSGSAAGGGSLYLKVDAGHIRNASLLRSACDRHGFLQTVCPEACHASSRYAFNPARPSSVTGLSQRMDLKWIRHKMLFGISSPSYARITTPRNDRCSTRALSSASGMATTQRLARSKIMPVSVSPPERNTPTTCT